MAEQPGYHRVGPLTEENYAHALDCLAQIRATTALLTDAEMPVLYTHRAAAAIVRHVDALAAALGIDLASARPAACPPSHDIGQ